jgi:hypothetical protein
MAQAYLTWYLLVHQVLTRELYVVVHPCNPSTQEVEAEGHVFKQNLDCRMRPHLKKKILP